MGLRIVILANEPVGRTSARIEVTKTRTAQTPGMIAVGKDPLDHQLAAAVGVDRILRVALGDRKFVGHAVCRAGRRKDKDLAIKLLHHLQKFHRFGGVVLIILEWIGHRLADIGECRKVHHRAKTMLGEKPAHELLIADIAHHQLDAIVDDGLFVTKNQIVQHHHPPPLAGKKSDGVGTDVAGSTGHENGRCLITHRCEQKQPKPPDCQSRSYHPKTRKFPKYFSNDLRHHVVSRA